MIVHNILFHYIFHYQKRIKVNHIFIIFFTSINLLTKYFFITETLDKLSIPSYDPTAVRTNTLSPALSPQQYSHRQYESSDTVDAVMSSPPMVQYVNVHATHNHHSPPQQSHQHQQQLHHPMEPESNSEDSSLSDGDRTLVGDVSPMLSTSNSPVCSDQQLSSPEDHSKHNGYYNGDDDTDMLDIGQQYYFKADYIETLNTMESDEPIRRLNVLVHNKMKISELKRNIEPLIKVPMEYFKIFQMGKSNMEIEVTNLSDDLTLFKYVLEN